ncbi:hypothetical protein HYV10_01540 [Candidatus Dependentiae bacterium]|nr:hypothetical protein [Candidatus Dependentiae bacterium]
MINLNKKNIFLILIALLQGSVALQARCYTYQPISVLVVEPSPVTSSVEVGACLGLGIASIVNHCKKKKKFRDYVETFRDMGYSKERSKVYAQMAMNNPEGLEAVLRSIDQENAMKSQQLANQKMQDEKQIANTKMQEFKHQQKMEQISHEHKLNLLTYIALFLSGFIIFGLGLLIFRRK